MSNTFKHLKTILYHKWNVFRLMTIAGHPLQGLVHDLSKFTPQEFSESVKYYKGTGSPINEERNIKGYSSIWLHHKGRNKHHSQYWIDLSFGNVTPVEMPWKYVLELICDGVSAGMTYAKNSGREYTDHEPIDYWNRVDSKSIYHDKTRLLIEKYYIEFSIIGIIPTLKLIRKYGNYLGQEGNKIR